MAEEKEKQQYVEIKQEKNDRVYRFLIPVGAPVGEAFDAAVAISRQLVSLAERLVAEKTEEEHKE